MMASPIIFTTTILFFIATHLARAQTQLSTPSPASAACNGVFLSYCFTFGPRIPPILTSYLIQQPYRFESTLTVLNNGLEELKSWRVFFGFRHDEYFVSTSNVVHGNSLQGRVGNGTVFAGFPGTDLTIETARDMTQMSVQVDLVSTQFGIGRPGVPMSDNIALANDGFVYPK